MLKKKNIVTRINRTLALRLKEARKEVGFSVRKVAESLPEFLKVSHSTIASYENGVTVPPIDVLSALASIYRRPLGWFLEKRESISGFRYLNLEPKVGLAEQRHFAAQAGKWAEAYIALETHFPPKQVRSLNWDGTSPDQFAKKIRQELNLDDDQPIQNTVKLLESFPAYAIEVRASFGVEGAAANLGDSPIIVVNPTIAHDRIRLNAMRELAILYFSQNSNELSTEIEQKANVFASCLLLPDSQLREAFATRSFLRLIEFKERFGISISVMINRAESLEVINTSASRWLRSEILKRGWRKNEPGYVWTDRAITFETKLESAIESKRLTWEEASRITSVPESELRERIVSIYTSNANCSESEMQTIKINNSF